MFRRLVAGFLAGYLASASLCLAQQDAVLVEATRFPEDVRRLPASTSVIRSEDIARSPGRTLPEVLSNEVGIHMRDLFGNNAAATSIDLRGFGTTAAQNTLILLDGRRLNDLDLSGVQWATIPLSSIERIEILRGTGSVLYGDAASAGVINLVTRSPLKPGRHASAFGRIGSFAAEEGQLHAGYGSARFGVNATLHGYASDGYRRNNRNEQQNASLNARWALGEGALDLRFGTDRQDLRLPGVRRIQPSAGLDEFATDPRGAQTPLDYSSRDGRRAAATLTQRFGEADLSLGLDYRGKDDRIFGDLFGFQTYRANELVLTSLSPRARVPVVLGGMRHQLTLGSDWRDWRYDSRRTDRPENLGRPTNRVAVSQRTEGFYVLDSVDLTESTIATLGARTERASYRASDSVDPGAPACFGFCTGAAPVAQAQKQRAWELGLRQRLGRNFTIFGRANRSFRFVNVDEIYEVSPVTFANQFDLLRPQHSRTHEAGVEWSVAAHSLRAALFDIDVSDEIHLNPLTFDNVNLPPSRRQGLELDGRFQAHPALLLSGGYAYTDARFLEGTLPGTATSIAGKRVPLVPRHKLNVGVVWEFTARTQLAARLSALSDQLMENDQANTFIRRIPAYATADVKLSHAVAGARLAIAVNNLFDKKYFGYAVNSTATDLYNVYPLPGRTLTLSAELALP